MKKIITLIVYIPLGIALIALCVANRQSVRLALNPFDPADSVLSISAPLFVVLFCVLIVGLILGATATWFSQGRFRRRARRNANEASKWQTEAARHKTRAETIASQAVVPAQAARG